MNQRIRELAKQAGFYANPDIEKFEKFAELVRADEREACAEVSEDCGAIHVAKRIRSRGQA